MDSPTPPSPSGRHLKRLSLVSASTPNRRSFPLSPLHASGDPDTNYLSTSPTEESSNDPVPSPSLSKFPLRRSNTLPRSAGLERSESAKGSSEGSMSQGVGTLVEQHAELLTFIAKKERKCLDLREELKKHEGELEVLKKKWQSIVSKSMDHPSSLVTSKLASDSGAGPSSSRKAALISRHSISAPSSHTPQGPSHSPNRSKGSFDSDRDLFGPFPSATDYKGEVSWTDKANQAKHWVGGVMGKVLDGLDAVAAQNQPGTAESLPIVPEELEDDSVSPLTEKPSPESKRASTASTVTSSSFGFNDHRHCDSIDSSETSPDEESPPAFTSTTKPSQIRTVGSLKAGPGINESAKHSRRKSTMDTSFLYSGVNLVGKKLAELNNSETFKTSRKAFIGSIESLEGIIIDAMVPLSPQTGQPASSELHRSPSLLRASPSTGGKASSPIPRKHAKAVSTSTNASRSSDWGEWSAW